MRSAAETSRGLAAEVKELRKRAAERESEWATRARADAEVWTGTYHPSWHRNAN